MYAWARGILHRGDDSENGDEGELDDRELADALEYLVSICPGVHLLSGRSFVLVTIESIVGLLEQAFSKLLINRYVRSFLSFPIFHTIPLASLTVSCPNECRTVHSSDELAQKSAYKSTSSTKISPAIVALAEMMRSISTEAEDKKDSRFTHDITTWTKEDFIAAIEDCFGGNGIVLRLGQPSWADSAAFARAHLITELLRDGGEVEKMITENGRWKIPTVEESLQQALSKLDLEEEAEEAAKKVKKSKKKRAAKKATVP